MLDDAKVEMFKEGGDASEEADALDVGSFGLIEEGLDEEAAGAFSFALGLDNDGPYLCEVLAVDVKCGTADELTGAAFDDGEGSDVGLDFRVGPGEEGPIVGEAVD